MTGRGAWAAGGLAVAVVGLVIGGLLWWVAGEREADAVNSLARAPVGCDTTLDFDESGSYQVFVEPVGRIDEVPGDCVVEEGDYDVADAGTPVVALTLIGPDGDVIGIDDADGVTYSAAGYEGVLVGSIDIETPGDHVMRVEGDAPANVAIGGDPGEWVTAIRVGAILSVVIGLAAAAVLLLRAGRTRTPAEPVADDVWMPPGHADQWPTAPPGHPIPPPTTGAPGVARPIPGQPSVPGAPDRDPWAPPGR